jgi:hypothetical protein
MKFRLAIGGAALMLAATVALVAGTTGTASAASGVTPAYNSSTCSVIWPSTSCKTGTIRSNGATHRIYFSACAAPDHYADWQVKDADNGVIVGQGRLQAGVCDFALISGLYGAYWGWVFNTRGGASAHIDNRF